MNARTLFNRNVPGAGLVANPNQKAELDLSKYASAQGVAKGMAAETDKNKTATKRDKQRDKAGQVRTNNAPASAHLIPQRSNAQASSSGG